MCRSGCVSMYTSCTLILRALYITHKKNSPKRTHTHLCTLTHTHSHTHTHTHTNTQTHTHTYTHTRTHTHTDTHSHTHTHTQAHTHTHTNTYTHTHAHTHKLRKALLSCVYPPVSQMSNPEGLLLDHSLEPLANDWITVVDSLDSLTNEWINRSPKSLTNVQPWRLALGSLTGYPLSKTQSSAPSCPFSCPSSKRLRAQQALEGASTFWRAAWAPCSCCTPGCQNLSLVSTPPFCPVKSCWDALVSCTLCNATFDECALSAVQN